MFYQAKPKTLFGHLKNHRLPKVVRYKDDAPTGARPIVPNLYPTHSMLTNLGVRPENIRDKIVKVSKTEKPVYGIKKLEDKEKIPNKETEEKFNSVFEK